MSATDTEDVFGLEAGDYQKATVEVAFLLDAFATTIDNIMGGNTAPVGRISGRDTASKLPLHLEAPTLQEVVQALGRQLRSGFSLAMDGDELVVGSCILRDMCAVRRIETGGPLCRLFHSYLDGLVDGLLCRPVKSSPQSIGATCRFKVDVQ